MNSTNITAHTLVKNEEKWVWFSIMSVMKFVDKLIIYDTGSTDNTVKIIQGILKNNEYSKKIIFEEKGSVTPDNFAKLRQEQIDKTDTDWFLVLDGDEIWYESSLIEIVNTIKVTNKKMLAIRFHNCTKDIYHYTKFESGSYNIKNIKGNITLKLINKSINGLIADGPYGIEGYYDYNGSPIQEDKSNIHVISGFFLHTSNLVRSKNLFHDWKIPYRRIKVFARPEDKVRLDFVFPEVFYLKRPEYIIDPFKKAGFFYYLLRLAIQPYRVINFLKRI